MGVSMSLPVRTRTRDSVVFGQAPGFGVLPGSGIEPTSGLHAVNSFHPYQVTELH